MRKGSLSIVLLLGVLALAALCIQCSRGTAPTEENPIGIAGTWEWYSSSTANPYATVYASSVDYTRKVVFDSRGYCQYYRNDTLETWSGYELKYEVINEGLDTTWVVHYDADNLHSEIVVFYYDGALLELAGMAPGTNTHRFIRLP